MSLFGQVWLWSLLAFVVGVLLTWLLLVRPAQARVRELERRVVAHRAEPVATSSDHSAGYTAPGVNAAGPVPEAGFGEVSSDTARAGDEQPAWDESQQTPGRHGNEDAATQLFEPVDPAPPQRTEPQYIEPRYARPEHTESEHTGSQDTGPQNAESRYGESPHAESETSRGLFQPAVPSAPQQHDQQSPPEPEPAPAQPEPHRAESTEMPAGHSEPSGEPVLPKRQRREAPPGGFDPPEPIQPSMRAVTRREPMQDGGHSGSLFEPSKPTDSASDDTADAAAAAPPADEQSSPGTQVGPFGPGSAMPLAGGGKPSEDFAVKASVTTLRYCPPESERFSEMVAEVWFRTAQDAERVGFRPVG